MRTPLLFAALVLAACNQPESPAPEITLAQFTVEVPGQEFPTHTALQLRAVAIYSDGRKVNVSAKTDWTTLDSNVGVIGTSGIAQLNGVGLARFEGVFEGHHVPVNIQVTGATLESLSLFSTDSAELARGDTRQFSARARFSDGSIVDVTEQASWSVAGTLKLERAGVVKGVDKGFGDVRVRYFSQSAGANFEIVGPRFRALHLNGPWVALSPGSTWPLQVEATFSDGSRRDVSTLAAWTSSKPNVVDVSPSGALFARADGRARITASWNDAMATIELVVDPRPVVGVHFTLPALHLPAGRSGSLELLADFEDGSSEVVSAAAQWASTHPSFAEVAADGTVSAHSMGAATIVAHYAGHEATYDVMVTAPVLTAINATMSGGRLVVGQEATLMVSGTFSDGAVLNLSPMVSLFHGAAVTAEHGNNQIKVTGALLGTAEIELELAGVSTQVTFEVSDAHVVTLEVHPYPRRMWTSSNSSLEGPNRFHAVAIWSDGAELDATELCTWFLGDTTIASISNLPGSRGHFELSLGGQSHVGVTMVGLTSALYWEFPAQP
ncbi:MAG: hypothetical protein Q8N23_33250 [Archangium sp.]|nr:hypothetical protein [Archangium sp.]MDP3157584.1 hypothetical protein [Archangium sp.]MDP3571984.1 hypothetical protein [Archangium sp.]